MNNDRLTDLEIKLAFQEDLVDSLNQVVTAQQRELELLQGQVRLLYQQLKSLQPSDIASVADEAPPPHYWIAPPPSLGGGWEGVLCHNDKPHPNPPLVKGGNIHHKKT